MCKGARERREREREEEGERDSERRRGREREGGREKEKREYYICKHRQQMVVTGAAANKHVLVSLILTREYNLWLIKSSPVDQLVTCAIVYIQVIYR